MATPAQPGGDGRGGAGDTCWSIIQRAAAGSPEDCSVFARRYIELIRASLAARWARTPLSAELDDAVQEVFIECFRQDGVLQKADPARPAGFRSLLLGVARNVALRVERRCARLDVGRDSVPPEELQSRDARMSQVFDRAWAQSIMRQASELQRERATTDEAARRVELLRLRFEEGLPIREIAALWDRDPAAVHRHYRKARMEFRDCLRDVVVWYDPGAAEDPDRECRRLAALLQ